MVKYRMVVTMMVLSILCVSAQVSAQGYSLKEITPQVQKALDARKARYDRIEKLKKNGMIGENNRGYVATLEMNKAAAQLVDEENQNRRVIYYAIAEQNGLERKEEIVEKVFAEIKREKARSGAMVQLETGDWVRKK